jgi:hypothetical protein
MGHQGFLFCKLTKGWTTVKKMLALVLAVLVGAAMVSLPMGCTEKKAEAPKTKDGATPPPPPPADKKDEKK